MSKCKELGIKSVSSKNKDELISLNISNENKLDNVMKQLLETIPKDKQRKVCKNCNELGHAITSTSCKLNIEKNDKLRKKIKNYFLLQDCLNEKTVDQHCEELSVKLEITSNFCKTLYSEIPPIELLDRFVDIDNYIIQMEKYKSNCYECCKKIYNINANTNRQWKGNIICDNCWSNHEEERNDLWKKVDEYRKIECVICKSIQTKDGERFHYDHINMFNKGDSICSMVNAGVNIDEIYKEIDKCQILCLTCHHFVTDIENKLGFTRIKQSLTRQLNGQEIQQEEYDNKVLLYQEKYEEKMKTIYEKLRKNY